MAPINAKEIADAIVVAAHLNMLMSAAIAFCMTGAINFIVSQYRYRRRLARRRRALARAVMFAAALDVARKGRGQ